MDGFIFFLVWLMLAIGIGALANSRGRSAFGFFLLSAIMSPLLGLIVVLVMSNKTEEAKKEQLRKEENERQLESIRAIASRADATPTHEVKVSVADELSKLADLRDKGILSDGEFQTQKAALLSKA